MTKGLNRMTQHAASSEYVEGMNHMTEWLDGKIINPTEVGGKAVSLFEYIPPFPYHLGHREGKISSGSRLKPTVFHKITSFRVSDVGPFRR